MIEDFARLYCIACRQHNKVASDLIRNTLIWLLENSK